MTEINLPGSDCFVPPEGFEPFDIECLAVEDLRPDDLKPGGRTVIVTPYSGDVCSGQYGQFQVLNGLGGQIHRALYMGSSTQKIANQIPGVTIPVDCTNKIKASRERGGSGKKESEGGGDKAIAVRDRGRWYVVKLGEGDGSSGTSLVVGTVVGGNGKLITAPDEFATNTVFAFPLPFLNEDDEILELPEVEDWEELELPTDFAIGDKIPPHPYGLCYVKLERPFTVGVSSWDANLQGSFTATGKPGEPATVRRARAQADSLSEVSLFWSREGGLADNSLSRYTFSVNLLVSEDSYNLPTITATAVTYDDDTESTVLTLSRAIDPDQEEVTVEVAVGSHIASGDAEPSDSTSAVVTIGSDAYVMIRCVNRVGSYGFVQGDRVFVDSKGFSLTDDNDVAKTVYDIVAPASAVVPPHNHLGAGGGGPAGLSPIR